MSTPAPTRLDRRLLTTALAITVPDLVAVFIDHRPAQAATCGACLFRYTPAAPACPSRVLATGLLKRRRHENPDAVADIAKELNRTRDDRVLPTPPPAPSAPVEGGELFPVNPTWRTPRRSRSRYR